MINKYKYIMICIVIIVMMIDIIVLPLIHPPKKLIVYNFIKNYDVFQSIADHSMDTEGNLFVCRRLVNIFGPRNINKDVDLPPVVRRNILKLIVKLSYNAIQEGGSHLYFQRNVGGYEQGIIFCADDTIKESKSYYYIEKIKDRWYYYVKLNN